MIVDALRPLAVPIDSVSPDPANERRHPRPNSEATRASLLRYGQRKPIVVNRRTGLIEAGNDTWAQMRDAGATEIAVVFVDDDQATAADCAGNRARRKHARWALDAEAG